MGFHDQPIVDIYSKNEENSKLHIRGFLKRDCGFICREDNPDYGCDLTVELVHDDKGASNRRFYIQVKSEQKVTVLKKEPYISYSFETSRLGYLMNGVPAMGYVMLYSTEDQVCYFEHVGKIYERLLQRGTEDWKTNDSVNIHIPIKNILNKDSVAQIHSFISTLYDHAEVAIGTSAYNIPNISVTEENAIDLSNPQAIKDAILKYGFLLIRDYEIDHVYQLLLQLRPHDIIGSKDLLLISIVVYNRVGKNIDANYYIAKIQKFFDQFDNGDLELLKFYTAKVAYELGEISSRDYMKRLKESCELAKNDQNNIVLRITILHLELCLVPRLFTPPEPILNSINEVFERIDKAPSINDRIKGYLRLWNTENVAFYVSLLQMSAIEDFKFRESLGENVPMQERKAQVERLFALRHGTSSLYRQAKNIGDELGDLVLSAYALAGSLRFQMLEEIDYFTYGQRSSEKDKERSNRFIELIKFGVAAGETFVDHAYLKEAYHAYCNAVEVLLLAKEGYGMQLELPFPEQVVYTNIKWLEHQLDLPGLKPIMNGVLENEKKQTDPSTGSMSYVEHLSDEEILKYSKTAVKAFGIPQDRLNNVVADMKAYRLFYQRNTKESVVAISVRRDRGIRSRLYEMPCEYVLKDIKTGIQTPPDRDMDKLLLAWGM